MEASRSLHPYKGGNDFALSLIKSSHAERDFRDVSNFFVRSGILSFTFSFWAPCLDQI